MFTGLVEDVGSIVDIEVSPGGARLVVDTALAAEVGLGDSVAVSGVCLTATEVGERTIAADVVNETLARSSLGARGAGDAVNLELAMRADGRFGGHIVQGHVDGTGTVRAVRADGDSRVVTVGAGPDLLRYVVEKGSIAVDGVSLTVAAVDGEGFDVALIPETLARTTLGSASEGDVVNLETDLFAKYADKLRGG